MRTLGASGSARQLPSRRYALGPKLIRVGAAAAAATGMGAEPILTKLVGELGETANMAALDRDMMVYTAQVPSPHPMRMFTEVGRRVYAHCTGVGKAALATLPESQVGAIIARVGMPAQTEHSIASLDALIGELAAIRRAGYATDENEQAIGVCCCAVSVPDSVVPTSVSVSGPAVRMTPQLLERAVPLLKTAARELSGNLSGQTAS
jgi:IclR family acetate operon transcriptional repressor